MLHYLKLYKTQLKYGIALNMAYRIDFLMWIIIDLGWGIVQIIFFSALYSKINQMGGWSYYQMLLLLGWYMLIKAGFWGYLWPNIEKIPQIINQGELDLWIIKPVNTQFLLSTRHISLDIISSIMIGITLVLYSTNQLHIQYGPSEMLLGLLMIFFSLILCYSLWFITITTSFFTGRLNNIKHLFPEVFSIAQFPKTAFPIIMQLIITFIIPVGILAYTPAQIILHRIHWWEPILPIFLAIIFLYLSHKFWNHAIRSYTSASS